jgi:alginate O-acetyltransferase complex protein AlgI
MRRRALQQPRLPPLFLPFALAGFYGLRWSDAARGWYLVLISLVFYGFWDIRFVPLLVASTVANWIAAWAFHRRGLRVALTAAIAGNLVVLAVYKYLGFFTTVANEALGLGWPVVALALPLGISFFTFHHIIYMADAARGGAPLYSVRDYALYITLFPEILAGPLGPDPLPQPHRAGGRGADCGRAPGALRFLNKT